MRQAFVSIPGTLAFLAISAASLPAQQALVGAWKVSYAGEVRVENGAPTVTTRTGVLTIAAAGDSLIANLVTDASPDLPPRPPLRLATRASGEQAVFESRSTATLNMGGNMQTATAVSTWTLKVNGDRLEGSLARRLEGMEGPPVAPQPVTGTRQKTSAR